MNFIQANGIHLYWIHLFFSTHNRLIYFSVTIGGAPFKGFFLQARDTNTNEWIGSWARTPNTNIHSECSAVTHADPRDKEQATFIWNAPPNARGSVYFTWVPTAEIPWEILVHALMMERKKDDVESCRKLRQIETCIV